MGKYTKFTIVAAILAFGFGMVAAQESAHVKPVTEYAMANIRPWLSDPVVVNAIKAQNVETAKLKDIDINRLDIGWMERSNKELIDSKMNNELSTLFRLGERQPPSGVAGERHDQAGVGELLGRDQGRVVLTDIDAMALQSGDDIFRYLAIGFRSRRGRAEGRFFSIAVRSRRAACRALPSRGNTHRARRRRSTPPHFAHGRP